jgi:type IV secretory pathway VirD2 relaxase
MPTRSLDQLLISSRLAPSANQGETFGMRGQRQLSRSDLELLEGEIGRGRRSGQGGGTGAKAPSVRPGRANEAGRSGGGLGAGPAADLRQQAVIKIHYFNHSGGGGGALAAHARYVARDAARPDDRDMPTTDGSVSEEREAAQSEARAHANYLARGEQERRAFYDRDQEAVDGGARAAEWAKSDKRHFRLILSAERGDEIGDLPAYTREVMARAEVQLGSRLSWVAADHHDTGHSHTHIILRGRRANGQDLVIPKDFIRHGFRNIARDVATEWLGARTRDQAREALEREVMRHAPTRLDRMIADQLPENASIRVSSLVSPHGDRAVTRALRARARELAGMRLAAETKRGVLTFEPDWQDRLKAMELHLDIRKRLLEQQRFQREAQERSRARSAGKGLER